MSGLSPPLKTRGYEPVENDLPGDWASNGRTSIQITSRRDVDRRRTYVARVYDAPVDAFDFTVELLAESQSKDHVEATRLALEGAER